MVDATFEMPERPALSEVDLELTHTTVMARLFGRPPATVRFGRFELTQRLGSGAQGEVYLAHDPGLDRPVAVKIVGQAAPGPQTHRDLRQEARALARLSHPNVLSVFDVGVHDGAVFVVTEYVRGSTLRTWLDDGPRTPDEILSVFVDAARGLAAVHAAGLVHRDFKPANVLIADDGRTAVADFGLAHLPLDAAVSTPHGEGSPTGEPGTRAYAAPEQLRGRPTPASDQFSFCVALFEALAGRRPFAGTGETLLANIAAQSVVQTGAFSALPRRVRAAILRGLAAEPASRHPSMDALVAALVGSNRRVRRFGLAAISAAAVGAAVVVASSSAPVTRPCDTGSITELWNPSARDAVEVALLQTGVPYAATTSATVRRVLDRYADAWGQQHQALCEAGREGTEDARMLDLRRLCLLRHRAAVAEYIAVLRGADAGVAAKAAVAASRLPAMSRCVSPGDLIAPPDDPVAAAVVARVLEDLGRAKVLREGGRYDAARNVVAAAEIQADAAAHGPTQARVMFEAGAVAHARGEYSEAAETLERATLTAVASGYDAVEADAATLLTTVVGWRLAEPDAGARWGRQAEAALERLGDDPRRRGNLRSALGFMARAAGDRDAALAHFRAAVAARTSVFGPTSVVVGAARGNLGGTLITAGELAAAEAELRASTEILEAALGDAHPIVGAALQGLGAVQRHQGKLGDALATTNRTVAISERTLGADHPDLAVGLASRALVQMERERYPEAIADFRRALHIRERVLGPEHADVGLVLNNLGVALRRAQDYHGALPVAERALRLWEATLGEAHPRVASANNNVGYVLAELGRWDEAEPHYRRAAALWDEAAGSHDDDVADALVGLGRALNEQARPVPALAALRRSASLMGDSLASNDDRRAQLELELGRALAATGEDPERALRLVTAARATLAAKPERNRPHIERADRWLRGERPSDAAPELAQPPTHLPSR